MLISFNWLKEHVDLPKNVKAKDLALKLTMSTVEVEGFEKTDQLLDRVFVGKIEALKKHPNADKLKVALVNLGNEKQKVVCGGNNLSKGMLVAFAKVGAKIRWHGEGEPVVLQRAKIRGVESAGMICASTEIGLSASFSLKSENDILDLTNLNLEVGEPLDKALDLKDVIFDIDNKSLTHRPDLWGHYGMAREVAALYGVKLKDYKTVETHRSASQKEKLAVTVTAKNFCPRYMAVMMDGIKVEESPDWLKAKVVKMGTKSINNIVDITNYILFDLGQPMHAFDQKKISGNKIIVRKAKQDEKIRTLDDETQKLDKDMLVIADEKRAVALAGVMGGDNSEITDKTKTIILESATFKGANIRQTSDKLAVRTESSIRFEKNLDPNLADLALHKAMEMIQQVCPDAQVVSKIIDVKNVPAKLAPIKLAWEFLDSRVGEPVDRAQAIKILKSLGFEVKKDKLGLIVKVPTWRATGDVAIPEDLVEEIARIIGYDNITPQMPSFALQNVEPDALQDLVRNVRNILVYSEANAEIYNYSFVAEKTLQSLGVNPAKYWKLENALDSTRPFLRQSLILNLIENVKKNLRFFEEFSIFEVGKVFGARLDSAKRAEHKGLPEQDVHVAGAVVSGEEPFYYAREIVENLLSQLGYEFALKDAQDLAPWAHSLRSLDIFVDQKKVAQITELHPAKAKNFNIQPRVGLWQLNLTALSKAEKTVIKFQELAKFPAIVFDLSIVLAEKTRWQEVYNLVKSFASDLIKKIELIDQYQGDTIEAGKKSFTLRITYQADDHTLQIKEAQKVHNKIVEHLKKVLHVDVR